MIDYHNLANSCVFYSSFGYERLSVPWWVSREILNITKPPEAEGRGEFFLPLNNECLVASGEQSFLAMASKGRLPEGKFFTITPCFRDEEVTLLSRKHFIKNELINTYDVSEKTMHEMIDEALAFFTTVVPDDRLLQVVKTHEGLDIEYGGIEVGSYGIRTCSFLEWVYGTGCAEPRLSIAIEERNGPDRQDSVQESN